MLVRVHCLMHFTEKLGTHKPGNARGSETADFGTVWLRLRNIRQGSLPLIDGVVVIIRLDLDSLTDSRKHLGKCYIVT